MLTYEVVATRFEPTEAELTITAVPDQSAGDQELRGRLVGPQSVYAETIEIAYALRPAPGPDDLPRARVIIPEPNYWSPATPFLYTGPLELWQAGQCVDRTQIIYGLRQIALGPKGLRWTGQPLKLRGVTLRDVSENDARYLHEQSCNLLLVPAAGATTATWALADRFGFLVLGQIDPTDDEVLWQAEAIWSRHTSCLGWLLPQSTLGQPQLWHNAMSLLHGHRRDVLIGVRVEDTPIGVLQGHVSFLVCEERFLPDLADVSLPKIVLAKRGASTRKHDEEAYPTPMILGHVYRELPNELED
jgi:hypothetical protein